MQHSITARYAVRPAALFVRPSARARERRLGLGAAVSFVPAPVRPTVLRRGSPPLSELRGRWRAGRTVRRAVVASGLLRPTYTIHWSRAVRQGGSRRTSAAPAWRD